MAKQIPHLLRYPPNARDLLQAWDSADELILAHLSGLDLKGKRILILNDAFGALSSSLADFEITSFSDSFVSHEAIRMNSEGSVTAIHDFAGLSGIYDYVLMKLPKNLSFLEDELAQVSAHLGAHSKLIAGAMIKHLPKTAFDLLQKYIGVTTTSLAQKKARLIFADFQKNKVTSSYPIRVKIEGFPIPFLHHSNLFSREKLDLGTRFFLTQIPKGSFKTILDLGCANGIVGIAAKIANPQAKIIFSDESAMAIASARVNYQDQCRGADAEWIWTNCFEAQAANSVDLVLCNPPFHQHMTLGDFIARQMFEDAHQVLIPGGTLRVIGNSHLQYPLILKKIFGNSRIIATNSKFIIVDAVK